MEDQPKEKTPEEVLKLKAERAARRKAKKIQDRAEKRGMTATELMKQYEARDKAAAMEIGAASNRKKRQRTEEDEQKMMCTVYIGNLVYRAGETEIRRLFAPLNLGENAIVNIDLPKDKETGKFYGVAFVQFDSPASAAKATSRNNFKLLGRPVTVQLKSESAKRRKTSETTASDQASSSTADASKTQEKKEPRIDNDGSAVFVAAISDNATDEEIMTFFSKSGRVLSLRRIHDKVTKAFTGAAFIQFADATAAKRSLKFNRHLFHNRPLRVEVAKQKTMK